MISPLADGFAVWLKLIPPGLAWVWVLSATPAGDPNRWGRWIRAGAAAGALGVMLASLLTLALGLAGVFTPAVETAARAALIAAGLAGGAWRHRGRLASMLADAMPLSLLFLAGTLAVFALPDRGEWIAGGWDPGVYMNEAAALSRTGTFRPPDPLFHGSLTADERTVFLRRGLAGIERFPGVVTDPARQSFTFEFFRLTPSFFAAVHRSGGLAAMARANTIAGMVLLAVFFAMIGTRLRLSHAVFATLLLAAQPIWIYHLQFPTTEMLHLLLLCACLWFATADPRDGGATAAAALAAFAAVTNRMSDLPFLGFLVLCHALGTAAEDDRRPLERRHLALLAAAAAGGIVNALVAPGSIVGWQDASVILAVAAVTLVAVLGADVLAARPGVRARLTRLTPRALDVLGVALLAAVAVSWLARDAVTGPKDLDNLQRLLPFTGRLPMLAAAGGLAAALLARPRMRPAALFPLLFFFFAVAWMLVLRKSIVDLYPWATRRYVPYLAPFLAIAAGLLPTLLWNAPRGRPVARAAAGLLLAALLAEPVQAARRAWTYTQYNGLGAAIAAVAGRVGPGDAVLADHPAWGTPLALVHGRNVLGGQADGSGRDNGRSIAAILPDLVRRLSSEGRRVLCLTSTGRGIDVFPFAGAADATLVWEAPPYEYQVMVQHAAARQFVLQTHRVRFRLYELAPPKAGGGAP